MGPPDDTDTTTPTSPSGPDGQSTEPETPRRDGDRRSLRINWAKLLTNYAAVGVLLLLIVVYSFAEPHTFPKLATFKSMVLTQSALALVALGLVAPLVAGEFDLSIGSVLGFTAVLCAKMISTGNSVVLTLVVVIAVGMAIGAVNSFLIVRLEVSSFIATLATGIILDGGALWASGGETIFEHIGKSFTSIGNNEIFGVLPLPGVYVIIAAVILWYVLERTPLGRELYITGYGREAARLAGIRVNRRVVLALVVSSVVGALAGFMYAANLGSASPGVGSAFLLPAFAAAFLGSTTIRSGRFNVIGTLVAAALLAVGITGLLLLGAQPYVQQFFYGGALIISVAFAQLGVRRLQASRTDA
jgi:ribose transport system permease protein